MSAKPMLLLLPGPMWDHRVWRRQTMALQSNFTRATSIGARARSATAISAAMPSAIYEDRPVPATSQFAADT